MRELLVRPIINRYDKVETFVEAFAFTKEDLIITNGYVYEPYFSHFDFESQVIYQKNYGVGEPSDQVVEAIYNDIVGQPKRVIAIGGGTVIDIAKLLVLKNVTPVVDLFEGKLEIVKEKDLIIVPTTCGTGSEVTNISILELKSKRTKKGLAVDELYADEAVLIPELLESLPFKYFATSSIDALIHAVESTLSPKATATTKLFGYEAIRLILNGYKTIADKGEEERFKLLDDFMLASMYAGIAFCNAGCAAVHALSYPLGASYHVAHGESNYAMFAGVMKSYLTKKNDGEMKKLNGFMAEILACDSDMFYEKLEELLEKIIEKKDLHEYGVTEEDFLEFTDSVVKNQQRLLANNYVALSRDDILNIYKGLY